MAAKDENDNTEDKTTVRQLLHWATGDREAEAEVLADEADVSEEAAEEAVKRAHGDLGVKEALSTDVATQADAEAVEEELEEEEERQGR